MEVGRSSFSFCDSCHGLCPSLGTGHPFGRHPNDWYINPYHWFEGPIYYELELTMAIYETKKQLS